MFLQRWRAASILPLALILVPTFPQLAHAQTLPERRDDITVTATRLEKVLSEVGTSTTVLERPQLDRSAFALDALQTAPGVTINQNGAFGGTASVRIRGASSEQTLVLIDRVPVNDPTSPGGGYDFSTLDTDAIERIEILRGAQSTLWGTDAIGGVVSVTTRRPEAEGLTVTGFAEGGSFATFRGGAALEGGQGAGRFRLGATGMTTEGISRAEEEDGNPEEDGYEAYTLTAFGSYDLGAAGAIEASLRYVDAETEFDSFGLETGVQDGDEVAETEQFSGSVIYDLPLLQDRLVNTLQLGYASIDRENFTDGAPSFDAEGERWVFRYQGTLDLTEAVRLAIGAEHEEAEGNDDDAGITSLFALGEWRPIEGLSLTGGLRHDDAESFGEEVTGKLAFSWEATEQLRFRGTYGTGFKAPTIFQKTFFCCGATAPNPNLQAETSSGYDLGLDLSLLEDRLALEVTWFEQDVEDQITFDFARGGYLNLAEVETRGIELAGAVEITPALALTASAAWIEAEDGSGNDLIRVPEFTAYTAITYSQGPWDGQLSLRHTSEEEDSFGTADAWTRLDANLGRDLTDRIELYVRAENLLDAEYQQIFGYGTPGLSAWAGIRLRR